MTDKPLDRSPEALTAMHAAQHIYAALNMDCSLIYWSDDPRAATNLIHEVLRLPRSRATPDMAWYVDTCCPHEMCAPCTGECWVIPDRWYPIPADAQPEMFL